MATLLAEMLEDQGFWLTLKAGKASPRPVVEAQKVADLYVATGRFLEQNPDLDPESGVVRAIGVLREIADVSVLAWYVPDLIDSTGIPSRGAFEWLIRVDEVDRWADAMHRPLPLSTGHELPASVWPSGEARADPQALSEFIATWSAVSQTYADTIEWFRDEELWPDWELSIAEGDTHVERFREGVARTLWAARQWVPWARINLPAAVQPLAPISVLMSQSLVSLGWHAPKEGVPAPGRAYLSRLVRGSAALEWLVAQGEGAPQWLSDDD